MEGVNISFLLKEMQPLKDYAPLALLSHTSEGFM